MLAQRDRAPAQLAGAFLFPGRIVARTLKLLEAVAIFDPSAEVAELVDALDLGSSGAIRGGSSPPFGMMTRSPRLERR